MQKLRRKPEGKRDENRTRKIICFHCAPRKWESFYFTVRKLATAVCVAVREWVDKVAC